MEETIQIAQSTTQLKRNKYSPQDTQNIGQLCQSIHRRFKKIINDINGSEKIQSYILQINISPSTIIQSFNFIIQSNKKLIIKSSQNKLIRDGTKFYLQNVIEFLNSKNADNLDAKGRAVWYLQIEIKLHIFSVQLLDFKLEHDITNSPPQEFAKVWDKITIYPATNLGKIKKDCKTLKTRLHLMCSSIINQQDHEFSVIKKLVFCFSCSKYMIMNDSAKLKSFIFYRNPTIQLAQKIWNIPEEGAIKHLSKIPLQGIQTNLKMYIPADGKFNANVDIFEERPDTITIRLLYNKKIYQYPAQQRSGCCASSTKNIKYIDKAIIHLHGGGFIALSSRSTQNFTRNWANKLGIPIFSVDYRMPPTHPYPQAPEDCLTAYRFLMNHIDHYLNVKLNKVYITGDSAGGNLACVLTGMALKYHEQLAIGGLYLAYPAADTRTMFSHSRLYAINDPLLWPTMLKLCIDSYLKQDQQKSKEPFASPVLLTQQFVGGQVGDKRFPLKWPKTIITVGNKDPLYDDSLILMQRMVQSNIDCQCFVYDGLSHGFLSTKLLIDESEKPYNHSIDHLKKLIGMEGKQ